jgi:hypothetical protein
MKFEGLPIPDVEALRLGWDGVCPWWVRHIPWFADSAVQSRIWERFGGAIRDMVESYDRRLQAWAKTTTDGLVERFELQAALFREQVRRLTNGAVDGHNAGGEADEVAELDADLRKLHQGLVERLMHHGHPTVPVAGELQPL